MASSAAVGMAGRCDGIVKVYEAETGKVTALSGVDASVEPGDITVFIGPSGSGKSTLLSLLGLRDTPTAGELSWDGRNTRQLPQRDVAALRRRIQWVTQQPSAMLFPHLTTEQHLTQVMRSTGAPEQDTGEALGRVGLLSVRATPTRFLSGGEQQRLVMAAAAASRPPVLIADEPTAELDDESSGLVFAELERLAGFGSTVVLATHDPRAQAVATRVVAMRDGAIIGDGTSESALRGRIDRHDRVQLPPEAVAALGTGLIDVTVTVDGVLLRPAGERT